MEMKKTIALVSVTLLFSCCLLKAQDTLVMKNHSKVIVTLLEEDDKNIKYTSFFDPNGPALIIEKKDLESVIYSDGYEKMMNDSTITTTGTGKDLFIKGQVDAGHYYHGYKAASGSTLVISLVSPLVGLIPAIACSTTTPKESNLQYPDSDLYHKIDYQRGYKMESKRIKSRKVWRNWGIGLGVNLVLAIMMQQQ